MKLKLDLSASDLMELNDPETTEATIKRAHDLLDEIFINRDELIKCSISVKDEE